MARYIMAGRLQAISFVVLFAVLALPLPPLSVISNAAVALITLRLGWQQGLLVALAGSAALALLTLFIQGHPGGGFILGFTQWFPVILVAAVLNKTVSWTRTLQAVLALTITGLLVFHASTPDATSLWSNLLESSLKPILDANKDPVINSEQWIASVAPWMTGIAAAVMSLLWVISVIIGRYWQAQLYNPGGFGEEFRSIRLGKAAASLTMLVVVISLLTQHKLAIEIIMVAIAVFLFQGLSLVHAVAKEYKIHPVALFALYLMLLLLPVHAAALLAAFGIIDGFADLRLKLFKNK